MIYTVTLNPALDYVLYLNDLRFDDINRSQREEIRFGGKGINVSAVLKELGAETTALGFVGGFTGRKLCELLDNKNISHDFCEKEVGDTRINVKIRSGSELDINSDGGGITEKDISALLLKLEKLRNTDTLVISGSVPKSAPENLFGRILSAACEKGAGLVIDTSGKPLLDSLKYKPFLIKPNHHELGEIFDETADTEEKIIEMAKKLQSAGAGNVLVSRAENGAILLTENGEILKAENAAGKFIDSVGCGDSMVAGFITGFEKTRDFSYALKLSVACGNATAYSESLAKRDEIEKLFRINN